MIEYIIKKLIEANPDNKSVFNPEKIRLFISLMWFFILLFIILELLPLIYLSDIYVYIEAFIMGLMMIGFFYINRKSLF